MSKRTYLSEAIRHRVSAKAGYRCEYCRVYERHAFLAFHVDHIISLKHGGISDEENLAYACAICNLNKGTDIATYLEGHPDPVRFYHPRKDTWDDHFQIEETGELVAKTLVGQATIKIFQLNHPDTVIERRIMLEKNLF